MRHLRARLVRRVRRAAGPAADMPTFVRAVERDGQVQVVFNEMGGHISGLSYRVDGHLIKSSELDRSLSWLNLQRRHGVSYDKARDFSALLERSSALERSSEGEASDGEVRRRKEHAALVFAAAFYQQQRRAKAGAPARDYLNARGFAAATLDAFGVGFAPDAWSDLSAAAIEAGFTEETLIRAGLAIERKDAEARREEGERGVFDRSRGRIMFPIRDGEGAVVGFGARRLDDAERETPALKGNPKYVNSPASALFDKGTLFFGAPDVWEAVQRESTAYVVEGYTDALRLHEEGIPNAVALAGTALRPEQALSLAEAVGPGGQIRLLFDGDAQEQGARAALALVTASAGGRVVTLPSDADPATYFRRKGAAAIERYAQDHGRSWADQVLSAAQTEAGACEAPEGRYESPEARQEAMRRFFAAVRHGPEDGVAERLQALARSIGDGSPELTERLRRAYEQQGERKRQTHANFVAREEHSFPSGRTPSPGQNYLGETAIEKIRQANPILEVARSYTEMRPSGDAFVGLSPFHEETNPSFRVNPEKGVYYDFSTGQGGDVFTLVQEMEHLTFPEAARYLQARGFSGPGGAGPGGAGPGGAGTRVRAEAAALVYGSSKRRDRGR